MRHSQAAAGRSQSSPAGTSGGVASAVAIAPDAMETHEPRANPLRAYISVL